MNIGGIDTTAVIKFQARIMMGAQYERVISATSESDVIVACLRVAWNDAFRHVSENRAKTNKGTVQLLYELEENAKKAAKKMLGAWAVDDDSIVSEWICQKILYRDGVVYKTFVNWAKATDSAGKFRVASDAIDQGLLKEFAFIKLVDSQTHPLCFGHIQKLYNMALKLYLCLYCWKKELGIDDVMGNVISEKDLANADCPIDSIILKQMDRLGVKKTGELTKYKKFEAIKWSKLGTDHFARELYCDLQHSIREHVGDFAKSNLFFDFENWG